METAIDFKSLRAKFQEEIQSKERPSVPHKPKCLPPQAGRTTTPFIISSSGEDHNPAASSAVSRNDCKVAQANRPSCFFHHGNNGGSGVARLPFRDRQLPLVLPASSTHEPKRDPDVSSSKLVTSPIKCKKKAMPTPFKPPKFSKCIKDIIEGSGEHAENGKVHRPPSAEPTLIGSNGFDHQNGGSDCGSPCPSPEQSVTPPPTGENSSAVGGVTHVLSTLEKARKKFSPKSLLMYAKPKSFYASKCSPERSVAYENVHHEAEAGSWQSGRPPGSSLSLPQADGFARFTETDSHINGDVKPAMLDVQAPLARRPLPDLPSLGPSPMKPPRPPQVDLSSYSQTVKHEPRAEAPSLKLSEVPDPAAADVMGPENQAVPPPPEFDAPEFPDFEASVLEALSSSLINLAALELEATEFGAPQADSLPSPPTKPEEANDMDVEGPQRHEEVIQKHLVYPAEAVGVLLERSAGPEHWKDSQASTALQTELLKPVTSETTVNRARNVQTDSNSSELPSEPSLSQPGDHYEACDNVYEEVETVTKFHFGQNSRKRKGPPKNPYADSPVKEDTRKSIRHVTQWASVTAEANGLNPTHCDRKERSSPDHSDEKELRKREKQRLEREKKEQKEREKKENEMKKKFKITGQEEPMYHARVLVASKLRKHDLQVKSGDTVSIIRTTNCPKGKWLARDAQHNYGYISVMNVELNMKEMLELGKKAQASARGAGEADTLSLSSRSSHYNPVLTSSFTDDSEEWTGDDETLSTLPESLGPNRAVSMPDMFGIVSAHRALSADSMEDIPSQHEALQKLAVFFQNSREELNTVTDHTSSIPANFNGPGLLSVVEEPPYVEEDQFSYADVELLPPPELYADFF
ncbi:uncharacterized protein si:ch211-188c16.1 [Pygocentrus nattereri]|uniref:uncharacterized protein si:ch211-188c16.1 n=1 Tax=Pygocentrus nattereri TaxID=42514 RepID=UPI0008149309|nr:uncharacterized protein si:ch211-188c16.1 [Pygocentrus nattereri]